jgi:hypothetical protein
MGAQKVFSVITKTGPSAVTVVMMSRTRMFDIKDTGLDKTVSDQLFCSLLQMLGAFPVDHLRAIHGQCCERSDYV